MQSIKPVLPGWEANQSNLYYQAERPISQICITRLRGHAISQTCITRVRGQSVKPVLSGCYNERPIYQTFIIMLLQRETKLSKLYHQALRPICQNWINQSERVICQTCIIRPLQREANLSNLYYQAAAKRDQPFKPVLSGFRNARQHFLHIRGGMIKIGLTVIMYNCMTIIIHNDFQLLLLQGILLVYDITNEKTFENLQKWRDYIKEVLKIVYN